MFVRCDKTVPHGRHDHYEQVTVGSHTQRMRVECPGVEWPVPRSRCLSALRSESYERDRWLRCAREAGHPVATIQGEFHSTRNFSAKWSDYSAGSAARSIQTWAVAILVEAPTDREATRLASELAATHDQVVFDFYPVVEDSRVEE